MTLFYFFLHSAVFTIQIVCSAYKSNTYIVIFKDTENIEITHRREGHLFKYMLSLCDLNEFSTMVWIVTGKTGRRDPSLVNGISTIH